MVPSQVQAAPPDATLERAQDHQARGRFAEAAADYEQFAANHPDDEQTAVALDNAYLLRLGLGDRDRADAHLAELERLYAKTQSERAAAVFWSHRHHLDRNQARRDHAVAYLKKYRRTGGPDREFVAEAVIAQIDWRRSCHEPLLFDSCVSRDVRYRVHSHGFSVLPGLPNRCHGTGIMYTAIGGRNRELAQAAQKRLARLLERARNVELPNDPERASEFADAWAMVLVYRIDAKAEALLRTELPRGLALHEQAPRRAQQLTRLDRFLASLTHDTDAIVREYASVETTGSRYWTQAAALRTAELYESVAEVIDRGEIPGSAATPDQKSMHCAVLASAAVPMAARALPAYRDCFESAIEARFESPFMQACAWMVPEFDRSSPYPISAELVGTPTFSTSPITWVGVVAPEP